MTETKKHALSIFISYAHEDEVPVRKLYKYLCSKGFDVWFDKNKLVGGQNWQWEIEKGLNKSDVILICLSKNSVARPGFVQREFKFALERALDMPEGRIFLIPVRLEQVGEEEIPQRIRHLHWVDLFQKNGYRRLMRSLSICAEGLDRLAVEEPRVDEINFLSIENDNEHVLLKEKDISVTVGDSLQGGIIADNGNAFQADDIGKVDQEPSIDKEVSVEQNAKKDTKPEEQIVTTETEHITNLETGVDVEKMEEAETDVLVSPTSKPNVDVPFPVKKKASATLRTIIGITILGVLCLCIGIVVLYIGSSVNSIYSSINKQLTAMPDASSVPYATSRPSNSPVPTLPADLVPQGGLGDDVLRANTWAVVIMTTAKSGCDFPSAADTSITVTQKPNSTGLWKEQWTVACGAGKTVPVDVTFTPSSSGGTDISATVAK